MKGTNMETDLIKKLRGASKTSSRDIEPPSTKKPRNVPTRPPWETPRTMWITTSSRSGTIEPVVGAYYMRRGYSVFVSTLTGNEYRYKGIYKTFAEAKSALVKGAKESVRSAEIYLRDHRKDLARLLKMKAPKT